MQLSYIQMTVAAFREITGLGCRPAVFPEPSLIGYSCADLRFTRMLLEAAAAALDEIAHE
jgi:hypothetical protein